MNIPEIPFKRRHSEPRISPEFERSEADAMIAEDHASARSGDLEGQSSGTESHPDPSRHHTVSTLPSEWSAEEQQKEEEPHSNCNGCGRGGCGRGIVADAKQTIGTHWKSEMTNFNNKTIAVSFFLFFACISPAITFGAVYAKATHNWIGAVEMISATSWCGIVYAFVGGQPMMINGGTGPVLAFAEILYKMSQSLGVPFLTFNAWVGIWVAVYLVIAAVVDMNRLIVYATRFTDEIFSFLIAAIFIINALGNPFAPVGIYYYFDPSHSSHDAYENDDSYSYMASALLSLVLCVGTVQLSFLLRKFKFSPFLPNQMARNVVTDFAVVTSILVMTIVGNVVFSNIPTETLNVPDTFAPTYACCTESCDTNWPGDCPDLPAPFSQRPWLVDLGDVNGKAWLPIMAAGPAALAFILVFLDDGITWHLINHPAHKLQHGEAYNYDTLIIAFMVAINSLLGLPWLVAATVRSLNHIHAMAEKSSDGKIISVQETRLTHLGIHLLCLVSIFALDALKLIPVPVLYGVFLFMGLVSLGTNQFWQRILMFFMQPSKLPLEPYTVHMKVRRMHLFTLIQLSLFVLLYAVKSIKSIALAFPIVIALCIPIRYFLLPKIFTQGELVMIDSDDDKVKEWLAVHGGQSRSEEGGKLDIAIETGAACEADEGKKHVEIRKTSVHEEASTPRPRRNRRKTVSCPPHMLFAEEAGGALPTSTRPRIVYDIPEEEDPPTEDESGRLQEAPFEDEFDAEKSAKMLSIPAEGTEMRQAPRQRRKKTVSCPAHMLFAEADRQVNSNYFFG